MTPANTRELYEAILVDLQCGLVPFIKGSPGIGKTAMFRAIAKQLNLKLLAEHLSSKEPTDINGFPDTGGPYATFKPFENFPVEGAPLPINPDTGQPYAGWLLFLDEFNSASIEVQAACYSLILDRKVGMKNLHEMVFVAAAGNLATDNAIVNKMSSALTSRVVNYEMKFDIKVFLEDVVAAQKWDYRVAAYLEWKPEAVHIFVPEKAELPYPCPRTWDMVQRRIAIQGANFDPKAKHNRLATEGLIGQDIAREFIAFLATLGQIPTTAEVVADPYLCNVPQSRGLQFAAVMQLRRDVDANTLDPIFEYISRFDPEFKAAFFKGIVGHNGINRSHPVIVNAQANLRKRTNTP